MPVEGRVTYERMSRENAGRHADAAERQAIALERIASALEAILQSQGIASPPTPAPAPEGGDDGEG